MLLLASGGQARAKASRHHHHDGKKKAFAYERHSALGLRRVGTSEQSGREKREAIDTSYCLDLYYVVAREYVQHNALPDPFDSALQSDWLSLERSVSGRVTIARLSCFLARS